MVNLQQGLISSLYLSVQLSTSQLSGTLLKVIEEIQPLNRFYHTFMSLPVILITALRSAYDSPTVCIPHKAMMSLRLVIAMSRNFASLINRVQEAWRTLIVTILSVIVM